MHNHLFLLAIHLLYEGGVIMMMEYISLVGFILTVFIAGIAVGKFVEKIERFLCRKEAEEHDDTNKNDRR